LRLAAAAERVPHRAAGGEHRGGGIDGVPALLIHHRTGSRRERFPGDREPVLGVERWLLRLRVPRVHGADRLSGALSALRRERRAGERGEQEDSHLRDRKTGSLTHRNVL
jgi:hypothetical protein